MERKHFIPGLNFEGLATDPNTLAAFRTLLASIKQAKWDVTKAEETTKDGLSGLILTMNDGKSDPS